MDYILRDIDIELWSKVKAKATVERKTMREVIFENLKRDTTPVETTASPAKRRKGYTKGVSQFSPFEMGTKTEFRGNVGASDFDVTMGKEDYLLLTQKRIFCLTKGTFLVIEFPNANEFIKSIGNPTFNLLEKAMKRGFQKVPIRSL